MYSDYLAPQNCQSETGTENYDNFYVIKCGKTNGNELEINVYVDDPSEINILLAPRDDYNDNDKDNYEIGGLKLFGRTFNFSNFIQQFVSQ